LTWFKVDDGFAFHPKAIMAGNSALGLWVRAGAWCGANLTDGALPRHMIGTFGAQARDAKKLVSVGLWVEIEDGYQFHEWNLMQPTKADVEAERAANRARQKEWRDKKRSGVTDTATDTVSNAVTNDAPSRPDPTRPIEEEAKASSSRRAAELPLPTAWKPTAAHEEKAKEKFLDVNLTAEAFRNHAEANDRRARNWDAAFRNWILKATPGTPAASRNITSQYAWANR
jgi:hypothetical protein